MSEEIIYIDTSEIRPGKIDELKTAVSELVEFVNSHESLPFSYSFYFNEDNTRMTLIQVHPDPASLELHFQIAGSAFLKFLPLIKLKSIEVYGNPGENLLKQLNNKAQMLGDAILQVHRLEAGFSRFERKKIDKSF